MELKKRVGILLAVPYDPNADILFFFPGGSTKKISLKLNAAADLTIVPKFLAFDILNISMYPFGNFWMVVSPAAYCV